jgi:hypothetical protein
MELGVLGRKLINIIDMNDLQKLTGGKKPFFIDAADGEITDKRFYLLVPGEGGATFISLESNTGNGVSTLTNEKEAMNINAKNISAGIPINCDGEAYFTKVHLATGMVAAYEAF